MSPTPICLSKDKIKEQSGKNTTPTKTLAKKQGHSSFDFQIALFTY